MGHVRHDEKALHASSRSEIAGRTHVTSVPSTLSDPGYAALDITSCLDSLPRDLGIEHRTATAVAWQAPVTKQYARRRLRMLRDTFRKSRRSFMVSWNGRLASKGCFQISLFCGVPPPRSLANHWSRATPSPGESLRLQQVLKLPQSNCQASEQFVCLFPKLHECPAFLHTARLPRHVTTARPRAAACHPLQPSNFLTALTHICHTSLLPLRDPCPSFLTVTLREL
jgi:hypothetical protein